MRSSGDDGSADGGDEEEDFGTSGGQSQDACRHILVQNRICSVLCRALQWHENQTN